MSKSWVICYRCGRAVPDKEQRWMKPVWASGAESASGKLRNPRGLLGWECRECYEAHHETSPREAGEEGGE